MTSSISSTNPPPERIVVALGGNALLRRGDDPSTETQRRNLHGAATVLAQLARARPTVITHGNGPQVGLLAVQSEAGGETPAPLDVLGAQSQGMIGYMIEDELRDALSGEVEVATLLTQVAVEADDPAFLHPTKPIGTTYSRDEAERLASERGWVVAPDGRQWRRVVASPEPRRILELRSIELLLDAGVVVICAGGGGVPVVPDPRGGWKGVEAVVDKDFSAALLADALGAQTLMLLTDVNAVYREWDSPRQEPIRSATAEEMRREKFAAGSMGPKVEAACRFVAASAGRETETPRTAFIGALSEAESILRGESGTLIHR